MADMSHGGGAFSGKDCTKVDRSAAYKNDTWLKTLLQVARLTMPSTIKLCYWCC